MKPDFVRGSRAVCVALTALALASCGGRIVPPGSDGDRSPRATRGGASNSPKLPYRNGSARKPDAIIPATPMAAVPVASVAGATAALTAGIVAGPPIASLPLDERQAAGTVSAFARSCPGLVRRTDGSGLTRGADWQGACAAAADVASGRARAFLTQWFETAQVGDGRAFATGYYEPEIAASRERRSGYEVPIYGRPDDLVDVDLGQFSAELKGKKIRGRVDRSNFVPYYDRAQIEGGALEGRAPVLAWGADPAAVFFLQIQGSGRLRTSDGSILRVGYATQNGRDYTGIGSLMKARGLLLPGQSSMQGIVAWLHAHPTEGAALMNENRSFVFFRTLDGPPQGALGYAVTGGISAAVDPRFVPLGAPVYLSLDRADATGLWVAQDTGGAIKGANRFDTFWGAGAQAEATAGGMAGHGTAFLLLPIGTLARLNGGYPGGSAGAPAPR